MVTRYPASIDNSSTLPTVIDNVTGIHAVTVNILRDTAIAIEAQLGVKPAGLFSTVRARLDAMEALIESAIIGEISFSGDLSGTVTHQTVTGLQTNPIQSGVLGPAQDGYVLTWNDGAFQWQAKPTASAFVGSGDLSGTSTSQTVIGWENKLLDATTMGSPTDGYVPVWVAGSNRWKALSPESVIGELTLAGDVTGSANSNKVVALQHHAVASQTLGAGQDGYVLSWDNGDGYWRGIPNAISSGSVTPGTAGQIFITNSTPVSTWTSLINLELTHGRFTAGGSGSDFKAIIGPYVAGETLDAAIYFLPTATSPTANNYTVASDQVNTYYNIPTGGLHSFYRAGTALVATIEGTHGRATLGGSGSDFKVVLGPLPGAETSFASLHFLATATTAAGNNYNLASNATDLYLGASGVINFAIPGVGIVGNVEMTHGRGTFGGGGTDYSAVIGPRPAHPDQDAMIWLLPNGSSPNDTNYAIDGNGAALTFNTISAGYNFAVAGVAVVATIEGVHGRGTFGGSGSDFKAVLGPMPALETSTSGLWLLASATSPSATNMAMYSDGASTVVNTQSGTGFIYLGFGGSLNSTISHLGVWNFAASQAPTLSQTAPAATSAGTDMTLAPQAGGATSGQPGALVLNIAAPNGGSAENYVKIERGGTLLWQLGPYTAFPTTFSALYPGGVTPTAANYIFAFTTAGDNASLNSSALLGLNIGGASKVVIDPTTWTFTGLANILFDPSINLPNITHSQSTTGSGQKFTIRAQDGYTTHPANGGNLFLSSGAKNSSGTDGYVAFLTGGNMGARISSASALTGSGDGYVKVDNTGLLSFSSTIGSGGISPGTAGQIFVTNSSPASVWTSLISYEATHGRFSAGQAGSGEYRVTIGPFPTAESSFSAFHILGSAESASATTYVIAGNDTNTTLNARGAGGPGNLLFYYQASTQLGVWTYEANGGLSLNTSLKITDGTHVFGSWNITHGQLTAGGGSGGPDFKVVIGPLAGFETSNAALWMLASGTAASGTNPVMYSDGTGVYINAPASGGTINFVDNGTTIRASLSSTGSLSWQPSMVPVLTQSAPGATSAGQNFTIAPQAGGATSGIPGSQVVQVTVPNGGSAEGGWIFQRGASILGRFQAFAVAPTYAAYYFGSAAVTPTTANFSFLSDGASQTYLNGPAGGQTILSIGNASYPIALSATLVRIGNYTAAAPVTIDFGTPTAPVIRYNALSTAAALLIDAATSDVTPANLIISGQAPFASATVHLTSGHTVIDIPSSVGAGNLLGGVNITYGGNTMIQMGPYGGVAGGSYSYTALWFGSAAAGAGNYNFLGDSGGTSTYFNASTNLYFAFGGGVTGGQWRTSDLTFGSTTGTGPISFGWGSFAAPTVQFGFGGTGAVSPTISINAPSNDVAPGNLTLSAQPPKIGASTNRHSGQVIVKVPVPIGANDFYGGFLVDDGYGAPLVRLGHYGGPDSTYGAIYFKDAGSPNSSNFSFLGSGTLVYLNAPASGGSINLSFDGTAGNGVNLTNTLMQFQTSLVALSWVPAAAAPSISQQDLTTNSGTGQALTIHAQNETGTGSTGGNLVLKSGTGTSTQGNVIISTGSTTAFTAISTAAGTQGEFAVPVKFDNVSTPSTPSGGPVAFGSSGALKAVGTSGTITTMAAAEPHCPRCGADFVLEWENKKYGGRLAICVKCLTGALNKHGVAHDEFVIEIPKEDE